MFFGDNLFLQFEAFNPLPGFIKYIFFVCLMTFFAILLLMAMGSKLLAALKIFYNSTSCMFF